MRAREVHLLSTSRNRITLEVMQRVIESLAGIKGRKSMILVSQGFIYDVQAEGIKDVTLASRRHNVPIYFIDTRGLQGLPDAFTAAFGRPVEAQDVVAVLADLTREAEGSEALALDTGGFVVKNSNDLSGGITPRLERVEGVLPPRLQPDRPAAGRQVPQDRGQGQADEGEGA